MVPVASKQIEGREILRQRPPCKRQGRGRLGDQSPPYSCGRAGTQAHRRLLEQRDGGALAPGRRGSGPEAPGTTSQRQLQCVSEIPRSARVPAEARRAFRRWSSNSLQRAAPTFLPATPSTGQIVLPCPSQSPAGPRRRRAAIESFQEDSRQGPHNGAMCAGLVSQVQRHHSRVSPFRTSSTSQMTVVAPRV